MAERYPEYNTKWMVLGDEMSSQHTPIKRDFRWRPIFKETAPAIAEIDVYYTETENGPYTRIALSLIHI